VTIFYLDSAASRSSWRRTTRTTARRWSRSGWQS